MESSKLNPTAPTFSMGRESVTKNQSLEADRIRSTVFSDLLNLTHGDPEGTAIANLADMYTYLYTSIQDLKGGSESFKSTQITKRVSKLEREVDFLNFENYQLRLQLSQVEDTSRYMNLRVEGMTEHNNNNLINQTAKVLSKTGVQCHPADLDYAWRIGKFETGQIRPVLVRFLKESKRNAILYGRNNVNKNRAPNSKAAYIWINDDVSDMTRRNRKNVRDIATSAKYQGMDNIRVHGDGLVVGEGKYRHRDLDLLPPDLSLGKAKTREEGEDIFFQGEYSPLSNFFPSYIEADDSIEFYSAEQAFQFRKACFVGDDQAAVKILKTCDPYEVKRLSNQIKPKHPESGEGWKAIEYQTMSDILHLKFTQNEDLRQFLLATGKKSLHEATSSSYWAIGVELSSKALENGAWEGQDTLGSLLMDLRQNLRAGNSSLPTESLNTNNDQISDHSNVKPMSDDEASEHGDELHNTEQADFDSLPPPPATSQPPKPTSAPPKPLPAVQVKGHAERTLLMFELV